MYKKNNVGSIIFAFLMLMLMSLSSVFWVAKICEFDTNESAVVKDSNRDKSFLFKQGISYGTIEFSHTFYGSLIPENTCINLNNQTDLSVDRYDEIKKGQEIGINGEEKILSTFDGVILEIKKELEIQIVYRDFSKYSCEFLIEKRFVDYFSIGQEVLILLNENGFDVKVEEIISSGDQIVLKTEYFKYEQYMKKTTTSMKLSLLKKRNVLRIENRYLKNKIDETHYLIKLCNPSEGFKTYEKIIEIGLQNDYFSEILSANVFPYEGIV